MPWRALILRLAVASALLLGAQGCGDGDGEDGPAALRLRPGDCFDDPADGALTQADLVACDQPHDNEVFATIDHPAAAGEGFPGRDAVVAYAEQECVAPFAEYVGRDYDTSRYSLFPVVPSAESWERGDRQIVCALYDHRAGPLTGSARASGE